MRYHHRHHHHNYSLNHGGQLLSHASRFSCTTMLLAAATSVLILLLSICSPQIANAQDAKTIAAGKLRVSNDLGLEDPIAPIKISVGGNVIESGTTVPAGKTKDLDLTTAKWEADSSTQHTVMLLDYGPNQTRPLRNLYTAINIPGNRISSGQAIVNFLAPNPPCVASQKHWLALVAFSQRESIELHDVTQISATGPSSRRENLNIGDLKIKHQLKPVAATIFLVTGESNGLCSASSNLNPNSILTLSTPIMIAMVMLVQMLLNSNNIQQQQKQ